jgi:signal peptidase I
MTYAPEDAPGAAAPDEASSRSPARRTFGCLFELVETLVLTVVIYLVIHNFVAQPFKIEQNSMIPTLLPGEYVLIDKITTRFGDYERCDIVVFQPPSGFEQGGVPFIKRVIGVPGDTVTLDNGAVFVAPIGGQPQRLDEPYLDEPSASGGVVPTLPRDPTGTAQWTVPDDSYFVLGDNRQASQDSRTFGPIDAELIVGRAWVRYFPLDRLWVVDGECDALAVAAASSSATIQGSTARP